MSLLPDHAEAKRTISGTVTCKATGQLLRGVRVRAWDSDAGSDQLMGEAITDGFGRYKITYEDKRWDYRSPGLTTWRPDIYVVVSSNIRGEWVTGKRSQEYGNHRLSEDLRVDLNANFPKIFGRIWRWAEGKGKAPVAGIYIEALDAEVNPFGSGRNRTEFMGYTYTDEDGWYVIHYSNKRWDGNNPGTSWRPDIFIRTVSCRESVKQSNQRLADPLRLNLEEFCSGSLEFCSGSTLPPGGPYYDMRGDLVESGCRVGHRGSMPGDPFPKPANPFPDDPCGAPSDAAMQAALAPMTVAAVLVPVIWLVLFYP
jgi:hypothetical protein